MSWGNHDPAFPLSHVCFLSPLIDHELLIEQSSMTLYLHTNSHKRHLLIHVLSFTTVSRSLSNIGSLYSFTCNLMKKCKINVGTKLSSHKTSVYAICSLSFSFTSQSDSGKTKPVVLCPGLDSPVQKRHDI